MPEAEIRIDPDDELAIPRHAYPQANGNVILCKCKPELCRDCGEYGVPLIAPDPFETACDLMRKHWHLPWQERSFSVPSARKELLLQPKVGVSIVAYDRETNFSVVLAHFGTDDRIMKMLGALVTVHNEMIAAGAQSDTPAVSTISSWMLPLLGSLTAAQREMVLASGPARALQLGERVSVSSFRRVRITRRPERSKNVALATAPDRVAPCRECTGTTQRGLPPEPISSGSRTSEFSPYPGHRFLRVGRRCGHHLAGDPVSTPFPSNCRGLAAWLTSSTLD
ncbi:MAG TPA: hypothetical protein VF503_08915 [Sphingobium sp.]|uniref:hypothetical protein n=1 Tax=Sphingobium sp. TaxID=1912891 RepID=UPI002ED44005